MHVARLLINRPEKRNAIDHDVRETLYRMLGELKMQGLSILYISHRMHEIEALADTASVFRNGRHIETFPMGTKSHDDIVQLMIGREIASQFPPYRSFRVTPTPTLELTWTI